MGRHVTLLHGSSRVVTGCRVALGRVGSRCVVSCCIIRRRVILRRAVLSWGRMMSRCITCVVRRRNIGSNSDYLLTPLSYDV